MINRFLAIALENKTKSLALCVLVYIAYRIISNLVATLVIPHPYSFIKAYLNNEYSGKLYSCEAKGYIITNYGTQNNGISVFDAKTERKLATLSIENPIMPEFILIRGIECDESRNRILVLEGASKMHIFNIDDFKHSRTVALDVRVHSFKIDRKHNKIFASLVNDSDNFLESGRSSGAVVAIDGDTFKSDSRYVTKAAIQNNNLQNYYIRSVKDLAVYEDKDFLFVVDDYNFRIQVYNTVTFEYVSTLGIPGHGGDDEKEFSWIESISVDNLNKQILVANNGIPFFAEIKLFDADTLKYSGRVKKLNVIDYSNMIALSGNIYVKTSYFVYIGEGTMRKEITVFANFSKSATSK